LTIKNRESAILALNTYLVRVECFHDSENLDITQY